MIIKINPDILSILILQRIGNNLIKKIVSLRIVNETKVYNSVQMTLNSLVKDIVNEFVTEIEYKESYD